MFSWYVLAEVCFVYLEDVPSDDNVHEKGSAFRRARWHTRGWTLQEFLAPTFLVFLSCDWDRLGTKLELVTLLTEITKIRGEFITRKLSFHNNATISERMHWAAHRITSRLEDEAYCLLGLFDVNMPTLYGEGRRAFQRLQYELVKQQFDASLLAWGNHHDWESESSPHRPVSSSGMVEGFHDATQFQRFLLAPSPRLFSHSAVIYYTPGLSEGSQMLQPYLPHQWPAAVRT